MNIQTLSFQNFTVSFRADGYLNATEIAEHFGKRINNYLRNERTQEYISALIEFLNIPETRNRATVENQLVITQKGGNDKSAQGTWLHPKLAIDFARWLNPKFAVWCDMQIEKILHSNSGSPKTTTDERTPLRQAVSALVGKKKMDYCDAYTLIHQRFGVAHIDELTHSQIPQAIEYVHRLILDKSLTGEILEKASQQTQTPPFDRVQLHDIIANMAVRLRDYGKLLTLFQRTPIADDKVCNHELRHLNTLYEDLMRLANDWQLKNTLGEPLFERNAINFYGGASVIW